MSRSKTWVPLYDNEPILLYVKGSRGDIVHEYENIMAFTKVERLKNPKFRHQRLWECLAGIRKSFYSHYHEQELVPRISQKQAA
jgi:hypothetical protein